MALTQISTQGIKDGTITGSDLATNFATTGDFNFTGDNANILFDKDADNIRVFDGSSIDFGNSGDLKIHHTGNVNIIDDVQSKTISIQRGGVEQWKFGDGTFQAPDNKKIQLGNVQDLQIYHNGSHSVIQNDTGTLFTLADNLSFKNNANNETLITAAANGAVELYYDNSKKFETTSYGIDVTGSVHSNGDLLLNDDNQKILIGGGNDLQIYHDGSHSYIKNTTGHLRIGDANVVIMNAACDEEMIHAKQNEGVELYYDNSKKFETTSAGGTLHGELNATGANFTDDGQSSPIVSVLADDNNPWGIQVGNSTYSNNAQHGWQVYVNNSGEVFNYNIGSSTYNDWNWYLSNSSASKQMMKFESSTLAVELYYDNSKKFETKSNGAFVTGSLGVDGLYMGDNEQIKIGAEDDFLIYHGGSENVLDGVLHKIELRHGSEKHLVANPDGAVELYHDNSKKLETTANGFITQNAAQSTVLIGSTGAAGARILLDGDSNGDGAGGDFASIEHDTTGNLHIRTDNPAHGCLMAFSTNGTVRLILDSDGTLRPFANNTYDFGNSSYRWRNIFTSDLSMSNEGSSNDVDGTWGSYTIQEGKDDLFLINKRNGKKYKFNLTEVS